MKFELRGMSRDCSNEEILAEIMRVDVIVNEDFLTRAAYDKHGNMSSSAIIRKFDGWQNALIAAGLGHKYSGIYVSEKMRHQKGRNLTDEEILNELISIAKKLNQEYLTQEDVNINSDIIGASAVAYRFGSWIKGIEKAGLKISPKYSNQKRNYTEDDYFENLLNVWVHHGRQPSYSEMDEPPSVISSRSYEHRFGRWRKALEAFVAKMNQDTDNEPEPKDSPLVEEIPTGTIREEIKKHGVLVEDRRAINLSLRYKVLCRDKFKCARCGSSPALGTTSILHIDHIIPFSKGGKTNIENLQVLCKECNLGKGNRHFE